MQSYHISNFEVVLFVWAHTRLDTQDIEDALISILKCNPNRKYGHN